MIACYSHADVYHICVLIGVVLCLLIVGITVCFLAENA